MIKYVFRPLLLLAFCILNIKEAKSFSKDPKVRISPPLFFNSSEIIKDKVLLGTFLRSENIEERAKKFATGNDWLESKSVQEKQEAKLYTQFSVFFEDAPQAGDLQRYKAILKMQNGGEKWLSKDPVAFISYAPNIESQTHEFIIIEPFTLINYRNWKAYDLSKDLKIEPYIRVHYWHKDGKSLIISQISCPFDCPKDEVITYWKLNLK